MLTQSADSSIHVTACTRTNNVLLQQNQSFHRMCLRENIRIIERSTSMVRLAPAKQEYPSCPLFRSFSRPFKKDVKWKTRGLFKNTSRFADWNLSLLSSLSTCADGATTASLTQVSKRPATPLFEKAWHSLPWSLFCLTCLFFNSAVLYSAGHGALLLSSPQVSYAPQKSPVFSLNVCLCAT